MRKVVEFQCVCACLCTGVYLCLCVCMSVIDCMRCACCVRARACVCLCVCIGKNIKGSLNWKVNLLLPALLRTRALPLSLCFSLARAFSLFRPLSQCVLVFLDVTLSQILLGAVSACSQILLGTVSATTCSGIVYKHITNFMCL